MVNARSFSKSHGCIYRGFLKGRLRDTTFSLTLRRYFHKIIFVHCILERFLKHPYNNSLHALTYNFIALVHFTSVFVFNFQTAKSWGSRMPDGRTWALIFALHRTVCLQCAADGSLWQFTVSIKYFFNDVIPGNIWIFAVQRSTLACLHNFCV